MTIETIYETDNYRFDYDARYGTCWYVRKSDDYVTLMDTGTDAELEVTARRQHAEIEPKEKRDYLFDSYAAEFSYSPRWSED